MTQRLALPLRALLLAAAFAPTGCEEAEKTPGTSWNGTEKPAASQPAQTSTQQTAASTQQAATATQQAAAAAQQQAATRQQAAAQQQTASATAAPATRTAAPPAATTSTSGFNWTFGRVDGSGAVESGVRISGLQLSPDGLSFSYVTDLSAWGLSHGAADAYACLFVKRSDGWVGGKFDWISSSRTTRSFENVYHGYQGWSLAGVPNPCNAAFLILSKDKKKRSNVLYGTWSR